MAYFDCFILSGFLFYALKKETRAVGLCFLVALISELTFHPILDGVLYYLFVATLETLLFIRFMNMNKLFLATVSLFAVCVHFYGFLIFELYLPPTSYNTLGSLVMVVQLFALGNDTGNGTLIGNIERLILVCRTILNNQKQNLKV